MGPGGAADVAFAFGAGGALALEAAANALERDGAVCVRGVLRAEEVEELRAGVGRVCARLGPLGERIGTPAFVSDLARWREVPEYASSLAGSAQKDLAAALLRCERATFYHEHTLVKEPGAARATPLHQDQAYYPVDGRVVSLWVALDSVPRDTSLRFVRGSHATGRWYVPRTFAEAKHYDVVDAGAAGDRVYELIEEGDGAPEPDLCWDVEPGDVVAFTGMTLHDAPGNGTARQRRVVTTRWVAPDAVLAPRPWAFSPPVTGGLALGQPLRDAPDTFPTFDCSRSRVAPGRPLVSRNSAELLGVRVAVQARSSSHRGVCN